MFSRSRGFALVDALVGVAVLAISVLTVIAILNQSARNLELISERLENFRSIENLRVWLTASDEMPAIPLTLSESRRLIAISEVETLAGSKRYRVEIVSDNDSEVFVRSVWVSR